MKCRCPLANATRDACTNGDTFYCPEHGVMIYWTRCGHWHPEIPLDSDWSSIASAQGQP
jgi:hypothetical protein